MDTDKIRLGVVGCGGFGLFALQMFTQHPEVRLVAMAETHREAAFAAARRFGIPDPLPLHELLAMDVDLVYVATPPFLHFDQASACLQAGKHVIVEKPLAISLAQADRLVAQAQEGGLLLIANLMQRYNPLFDAVKSVIEEGLLGEVLHGYFENYASDEGLSPSHWFWDRDKSGGIFIEHAVHFFDLFAGWLGEGKVESSQRSLRPGTDIEDQVQCTVRYQEQVLVNFYHGFTQPNRMDRQELRILFEHGTLTLYDWIPCRAQVHAAVDEAQTRRLMELFPRAQLDVTANFGGKDRQAMGRHKPLDIYQVVEISHGDANRKLHVYGELLRELIADQVAWIRDPSHSRRVTHENGRDSLAMAEAARLMADH